MPKTSFNNVPEKNVSAIRYPLVIRDKSSELVIKSDLNEVKGTFKISTHITTKMIDFANKDARLALLKTLSDALGVAIEEAVDWSKDWAKSNEVEGQLALES